MLSRTGISCTYPCSTEADVPTLPLQVLCAWPRVCMTKPFNLKYDGTIEWATDDDGAKLQAWKDGKTGFPIVDAAMRSLKKQGCTPRRTYLGVTLHRLRVAPSQTCTTVAA